MLVGNINKSAVGFLVVVKTDAFCVLLITSKMKPKKRDRRGVQGSYVITATVSAERWETCRKRHKFTTDTEIVEFLLNVYAECPADYNCTQCSGAMILFCRKCMSWRHPDLPVDLALKLSSSSNTPVVAAAAIEPIEQSPAPRRRGRPRKYPIATKMRYDSVKKKTSANEDYRPEMRVVLNKLGNPESPNTRTNNLVTADSKVHIKVESDDVTPQGNSSMGITDAMTVTDPNGSDDDDDEDSDGINDEGMNEDDDDYGEVNVSFTDKTSSKVEVAMDIAPLAIEEVNVCPDCDQIVSSKIALRRHRWVQHGVRNPSEFFCCHICQKRLTQANLLRKHMEQKHGMDDDGQTFDGSKSTHAVTNAETSKGEMLDGGVLSDSNTDDTSQSPNIDIMKKVTPARKVTRARTSLRGKVVKSKGRSKWMEDSDTEDEKLLKVSCVECGERFRSTGALVRHRNNAHPVFKNAHKCPECGMVSNRERYMRHHRWEVHGVGNPDLYFTCKVCSKRFGYKAPYTKHMRFEHSIEVTAEEIKQPKLVRMALKKQARTCSDCGKDCHNKQRLKEHRASVHGEKKDTSDQPFGCEFCPKRFFLLGHRDRHVREFHSRPRENLWSTMTLEQLNQVLVKDFVEKSIHGTPEFKKFISVFATISGGVCPICKHTLKDKLANHMASHMPEPPYQCQVCHERFPTHHSHKFHVMKVHQTDQHVKCQDCGKVFVRMNKLKQHRRRKHLKEKNVMCQHCGKEFYCSAELRKHCEVHHTVRRTRHLCTTCGNTFATQHTLWAHQKIHNRPSEKQFSCDQCPKRFFDQFMLQRHLSITHKNVRAYTCVHCHKGFKFKNNRDAHERIHTGELPYQCQDCGKSFISSTRCLEHRRRYHGVKTKPPARPFTKCLVVHDPSSGIHSSGSSVSIQDPHMLESLPRSMSKSVPHSMADNMPLMESMAVVPPRSSRMMVHHHHHHQLEERQMAGGLPQGNPADMTMFSSSSSSVDSATALSNFLHF